MNEGAHQYRILLTTEKKLGGIYLREDDSGDLLYVIVHEEEGGTGGVDSLLVYRVEDRELSYVREEALDAGYYNDVVVMNGGERAIAVGRTERARSVKYLNSLINGMPAILSSCARSNGPCRQYKGQLKFATGIATSNESELVWVADLVAKVLVEFRVYSSGTLMEQRRVSLPHSPGFILYHDSAIYLVYKADKTGEGGGGILKVDLAELKTQVVCEVGYSGNLIIRREREEEKAEAGEKGEWIIGGLQKNELCVLL